MAKKSDSTSSNDDKLTLLTKEQKSFAQFVSKQTEAWEKKTDKLLRDLRKRTSEHQNLAKEILQNKNNKFIQPTKH